MEEPMHPGEAEASKRGSFNPALARCEVLWNTVRMLRAALSLVSLCFCVASALAADPAPLIDLGLCQLADEAWADGDSFPIIKPDGKTITIRLYGVDCIETNVAGDDSNARRLRDQRRYFGVADIEAAHKFGFLAKVKTKELLSRPFHVHTSFADGRGDPKFQRVYGFVTLSDGTDLAETLVRLGLARAFGVCRARPDGASAEEWEQTLKDLELQAGKRGLGVWGITDWEKLPDERKELRAEEAELERVQAPAKLKEGITIDLNSASRDELMLLPGIGDSTALAIIAGRPYTTLEDLLRIRNIGAGKLEKLRTFLRIGPPLTTSP